MPTLARIVLVRHGETVGESRIRYFGSTDIALSDEGRVQANSARLAIPGVGYDRIVSSPLLRAWQTAVIVARGRPIQLEHDFREVDFGLWEGLTAEEIAERDPLPFAEWQRGSLDFIYPGGEARSDFRARVERGLRRLTARGDTESAIVVAHKGVVRTLAELLTGETVARDQPPLGGIIHAIRRSDDRWHLGRRATL
jgi:broad specificity phosphatase PhoE